MLSIIAAISENGVIGNNNDLIWHLPADLKRFKKITSGHTVILGRKTFQSLPGVLPNRYHIIITKDKNFFVEDENVEVVNSLDEIITRFSNTEDEVFIIGGGEIYSQLLPYTSKLYITKVKKHFDGDTFFPDIDDSSWNIVEQEIGVEDERNTIPYEFISLIRKI
ncbi:dihydrofolate reductase [Clostridium folliculivorans]|uniref:Dihydrofolate reductase n=1 Tax=Clostridium folliculivorans TaxID=2886038 RepID=A0A9W5Y6A0_9CLOT|nr:dihydrofolate reductase [Clostridium folliculivorans]GKU27370.1 dihydrofolate reductase [Clostridium folliculivorans]GKU32221.1 dihydrofolate reductase [Clostridium folliculivorans]